MDMLVPDDKICVVMKKGLHHEDVTTNCVSSDTFTNIRFTYSF